MRLFALLSPFHIAEALRAQFYVKAVGSKAAREGPASATSSQILPRKEHLRKIFFNKITEIETGNSFLEKRRWRKSNTSSQIIMICDDVQLESWGVGVLRARTSSCVPSDRSGRVTQWPTHLTHTHSHIRWVCLRVRWGKIRWVCVRVRWGKKGI